MRVKKGRIFGTIYSCQSNRRGKLLISRFSIHKRGGIRSRILVSVVKSS